MSTIDTIQAGVTAAKDSSLVDSIVATQPVQAVVETTKVVVTTADAIAQMGLFQFGLLLAAFGFVIAIFYWANAFQRIASALENGRSLSQGQPTPVVPNVSSPSPNVGPSKASIHPGMSDEKLVALLTAAAVQTLGPTASVVKFRSAENSGAWTQQGRAGLHTHKS